MTGKAAFMRIKILLCDFLSALEKVVLVFLNVSPLSSRYYFEISDFVYAVS